MAQFFIRRPIVAMVIAIVTVIVGNLSRLPIAEYPQVSPTLIEVTANYRGAAAEAVMDSVATPIESKVNGVDKMLYMQSFSANDGKMVLKVTFDVRTNVDIMQVNTQNRVSLATAQLPDAVKREGVTVNRSSPDLLMVLGLYSPKGTALSAVCYYRRGGGRLFRNQRAHAQPGILRDTFEKANAGPGSAGMVFRSI